MAPGASPGCIPGRHLDQLAATPGQLISKLASDLAPSNIQNGSIEARLLRHIEPWRLGRATGRARHGLNAQGLDHDHAVVFREMGRDLVTGIAAAARDPGLMRPKTLQGFLPAPGSLPGPGQIPLKT